MNRQSQLRTKSQLKVGTTIDRNSVRRGSKNKSIKHANKNKDINIHFQQYDTSLDKNQQNKIVTLFKLADVNESGTILFYQLTAILEEIDIIINDKAKELIFKELDYLKIRQLDVNAVQQMAAYLISQNFEKGEKQHILEEKINQEYIEAFVALGGESDGTGIIKTESIINIVKHEFDLTSKEVEEVINELTNLNEDLEYKEFCQIFEDDGRGGSKMSRLSSMQSLMSNYGRGKSSTIQRNNRCVISGKNLDWNDFEKFDKQKQQG